VNGATQTFRRPSVATTPSNSNSNSQAQAQAQPRDMPPTTNTNHGGVYIPPHLNANHPSNSTRSLPLGDIRYSKDQLLTIYQTLKDSAALDRSLEDIFLGSWDPLDGKSSVSNQGGRGEPKDQIPGPEVCWNYTVEANPFGMTDLTEDEKQV
jgi:PERQ amino acid-rich with GYF domain-containing protein